MNWDAIGAVGEILGAFAVFVSLGYLAIQLRRSSVATQHASQNAFIGDYNRLLENLFTNSELVDLLRKSLSNFDELSGNERERFHAFASAQHLATFNMYLQVQAKQFDRRIADPLIRFFAGLTKTPNMNAWWHEQKVNWDDTYVRYIDALAMDPGVQRLDELQPWWKAPRTDAAK